jgi:hypothetical protein
MGTPILTTTELRDLYGFKIDPPQEDKYRNLIAVATSACSVYLQRDLGVSTFTEFFDGSSQAMVLSHQPVAEVTGVYIDSARLYATPTTDYRIDLDTGVLVLYERVPEGRDVVKVVYDAGFESVPESILYAVAMTVQHLATMQQADLAGVMSRTTDSGTVSIDQSLPPLAVQKLLGEYRRNLAR